MNAASIDFAGEIQHVARALGRAPTNVNVVVLNETLRSLATVDPETYAVTIEGEAIGDYLNRVVSAFPSAAPAEIPPARSDWVKVQVGGSTGWRHVGDPFLKVKASIDGSYDSELAAEMKNWPNPWTEVRENRTHQTVMINKNPAMAANLKAEAKR